MVPKKRYETETRPGSLCISRHPSKNQESVITVKAKAASRIGSFTLLGLTSAPDSTATPTSPVVTSLLIERGSFLAVNLLPLHYVAAEAGCAGAGFGAG